MNSNESKEDGSNEDKLTSRIGEFGKWQIFLFVTLSIPIKFSAHTMSLGIIFLAPKTTFRCIVRNSSEYILNATCYSDCVKYEYFSQFENTIISEWGLICGREWLANLAQTVGMCGILVGSIVFGFISDRFGRRPAILISCVMQLSMSFGSAFCKDFWTFAVIRFLLGTSTAGNMITAFVMLHEITGPSYRELMTCSFHLPLAVSEILMPVFGFYLRSWDSFSIGIATPTVLYLAYFFVVPESPRWLISMGRLEEASAIMTKAAKVNNRPSENMLKTAKTIADEAKVNKSQPKTTYMDLVRTPGLRGKNLRSCLSWFLLGISFYGTTQYMGQTSSNVFISMALAGVCKIPTMLLSGYLYRRFGRRVTVIGFFIVTGICSALLAVPDSFFYLKLVVGAVGVGCSSGAFTTMYTYTSELFPTVTRNMAMGASSTVSRVGSALAPFVAGLKSEVQCLPPVVFCLAPLAAIVACWGLPETKGKNLSDTLDQAK